MFRFAQGHPGCPHLDVPGQTQGPEQRRVVTILWKIENLSHLETESIIIESSSFTVHTLGKVRFSLFLYPRSKKDDIHITLGLKLHNEPKNFPIDIQCSILDARGTSLIAGTLRDLFIEEFSLVKLPVCPTREEIFVTKKCSFLPKDILTVQCRIWKSKRELNQIENISLLTRIRFRGSSFLWPIQKFSSLQLDQEVAVQLFGHSSKMILLRLSLAGKSIKQSNIIFRITVPRYEGVSLIKFKVSVLSGALLEVIKSAEFQHNFHTPRVNWTVPTFVTREELLVEYPGFFEGDTLNHQCDIVYTYCTNSITNQDCGPLNLYREIASDVYTSTDVICQQNSGPPAIYEETSDSLDNLKDNFRFLYREQIFSDFELRSDGVSFPVHKCVLSARSHVFRAMFSNDMKESQSDFLQVPDLDAETLNRLLIFLYTGTVEQLKWEGATKLYYAADKYQVSTLKKACRSSLQSNIARSNVCDTLVLAERHQDQQLTSMVHDFILIDFDKVMHSKEWESFMDEDPVLAGKTTHLIVKKKYQIDK